MDHAFLFVQSYFGNNGLQNFLIFQPIHQNFKVLAGLADSIVEWESKEMGM